MLENIEVLYHSSIRINKEKIIYIDPFKINKNYNDADIIFITHDHYDHYSEEDIDKVINENTTIIIPDELLTKLLRKGINKNAIITVEPNKNYMVQGIKFETISAYNTNKTFHPKENGWVGYIITLDDIRYYIAVGNPCNVIKKRFDDELIEVMEKLKWWDKSIEEINNLIPILTSSDLEKVKEELSKLV